MVFSSIPAYLDPTNWHQQAAAPDPNHDEQSGGGGLFSSGHHQPPPPPPPPPQGQGGSNIRPGSMVDRARMANIPMPEAALKCPRCESTNTKFCYFNNYSLSQPRHFCKTCRRYWTRGGAMRSVPVGGGCRRNKRSSKPGPKSPSATAAAAAASTCSSGSANSITSSDHIFQHQQGGGGGGPLRFMSPLHNFSEINIGSLSNYNINSNIPLVGSSNDFMNFHSLGTGIGSSSMLGLGEQQWRVQQQPQFPFLDPSPLYPFEHHQSANNAFMGQQQQQQQLIKASPLGVKMEDSHHHHHHQMRQLVGNNDQFWSGGAAAAINNAWTDLSGFTSSSTTHNP